MQYEAHEMSVILFSKEDAVFGTDIISPNDNTNFDGTYTDSEGLDTGYNPYGANSVSDS